MEQLLPFFKALCDEKRIKIISLLLKREHCVCELIEQLELSQSTVSHHLKIIKQAGLLNERRCGTWNYYSIQQTGFSRWAAILDENLFAPVLQAEYKKCPEAKNC